MKAGGGKSKGSQFERDVCKSLSLWVTNGQKIDVFWRSAMSGGRATVQKGKVRQAGDICAVAPEGHVLTDQFYIECKHLKDISLDSFIKGKGPLISIWNTACHEAKKYNRFPLLIFRKNGWPIMFASNPEGSLKLDMCPIVVGSGYGVTRNMILERFSDILARPFPL